MLTKRPDNMQINLLPSSVTGWISDFSFAFEISRFHGSINRSVMDGFLAYK